MDELKQTTLKQPLKLTNNDDAVLKQLVGELNATPAQQQAVREAEKSSAQIVATEFAKAAMVDNIPQEAQAALAKTSTRPAAAIPAAPPLPTEEAPQASALQQASKLFITGQGGSGIVEILAGAPSSLAVVNLNEIVLATLKVTCRLTGNPPLTLVNEFRKFGDGEISPSLVNLFILGAARIASPDFGTPGFWVRHALASIPETDTYVQQVFVGLRTTAEFKTLQAEGFAHYHAMCSPQTAQARAVAGQPQTGLANALDSDVQKKISVQRNGPRLNVVWTDNRNNAPSTRFISLEDFRVNVLGCAPAQILAAEQPFMVL